MESYAENAEFIKMVDEAAKRNLGQYLNGRKNPTLILIKTLYQLQASVPIPSSRKSLRVK